MRRRGESAGKTRRRRATLASRRPSEVEVQIVFGCQTRRKRTRQTIELIAAITSTSSGPM